MTGEDLRRLRLEKEMTQKELAKAVGISPSTLQTYEYGTVGPKSVLLDRILEVLGEDVKKMGKYAIYLTKEEFNFLKDMVEDEVVEADTVEATKMYVRLLEKLEEAENDQAD